MSYRVALVGAGGIAVRHLEALAKTDRFRSVSAADLDRGKVEKLSAQYGIAPYTDYKEMIEREKPDVAVITLPHFLHKEAAVFCAERGCHMLLEKPMALTLAECDEIADAVKRSSVRLFVGHTQHYIAENRKAKQLIEQGELGELVMINDTRHIHYYREDRPGWFLEKAKAGGGILFNLGSHSIDKIQWLSSSRVTGVKAVLSHFGPRGDVEGSGLVFMDTDTGVPATIAQSGYPGASKNETEFVFTKGMLRVATGQSLWISDGGEYRKVPVDPQEVPFVLQFEDLASYIDTGTEPECGLDYARSVVAVTEAIYRSHERQSYCNV
ncbi:Inositol 2-dehydrogenase/D-chiro-inositol 3-dehydrogenase [Paenibacillus solanacearum]|uniref:Inositol 2-dehydrogenase/D-chiro-inositol 3-dehydrogenase n=1 Tax=Paenibacillus solanacearum TaxID=2048548 RepID=A0A916NRW3_9BACL|nr:Gfo/Idh/MocA family oxidoreductase [Paenibacillus solanacearum]CAG7645786.1 Inositol 2-dehydrogenase/D-chiro-inositol 3-dehydrogenase [Paenibacillus solanacearum]